MRSPNQQANVNWGRSDSSPPSRGWQWLLSPEGVTIPAMVTPLRPGTARKSLRPEIQSWPTRADRKAPGLGDRETRGTRSGSPEPLDTCIQETSRKRRWPSKLVF